MTTSDDPRGPFRKVISTQWTTKATLITFECGHVGQFNPIYTYDAPEYRCFDCGPHGEAAMRKAKEESIR